MLPPSVVPQKSARGKSPVCDTNAKPAARRFRTRCAGGCRSAVRTVCYNVCHCVPECRVRTVCYKVCHRVPEQCVRTVCYRVCHRVPECRSRTVCYRVCHRVPECRTRTVCYRVCHRVPEQCVRTVCYRVCHRVPECRGGPAVTTCAIRCLSNTCEPSAIACVIGYRNAAPDKYRTRFVGWYRRHARVAYRAPCASRSPNAGRFRSADVFVARYLTRSRGVFPESSARKCLSRFAAPFLSAVIPALAVTAAAGGVMGAAAAAAEDAANLTVR